LHDVLIAVVDGLRGFPGAIKAVYPVAQIWRAGRIVSR
jgi:putative transposase